MSEMNIALDPRLTKFVDEQVRSGNFATAAEVVEAGLARLMLDAGSVRPDAEDISAIEEGLAQADRGEVVEWSEARRQLRRKHIQG